MPILNPYFIIGALIAAAALFFGGDHLGHTRGVNEQKVTDQLQFDKINDERTQQKDEANRLYQGAQANIIALIAERDKLNHDLEVKDAEHKQVTAGLAAKYAGLELRFRAAQGAGDRANGAGTNGSGPNAPSADDAPVLQLPDQITRDLRKLTRDADELKDAYSTCYAYANQVK